MDNKVIEDCRTYISTVLVKKVELTDFLTESTILLNTYEDNKIWDLMVLLSDDWYEFEFAYLNSEHFVVDDHDHDPPVFTRVKSYSWLKDNFTKRLPVALWIFQNSAVIQESGEQFAEIITEQEKIFIKKIKALIRRKYLEMRGDRHNLRFSAIRTNDISNNLIKANVVKLCFEISLLALNKPYPFKVLLSEYTKMHVVDGERFVYLAQKFLTTNNPKETIALSDKIIEFVIMYLKETGEFSNDFLNRWWLYLD